MTQTPGPVDDGRLETVRESIDEAKAAEADLHDRDVLGAVRGEGGDGPRPEHREEPESVEQFDGPGPNPL